MRLRLIPISLVVILLGLQPAWAGHGNDNGDHGNNGGNNNNDNNGHNGNNFRLHNNNNGYMYYDDTPDSSVPGNDESDNYDYNPPTCGDVYNCDDSKPPGPQNQQQVDNPPKKEVVKLPQEGGTVILTKDQTWTTKDLKLCKPAGGQGMIGQSKPKTYRSATDDVRKVAAKDAAEMQAAAKADLEAKCSAECAKNKCKPLVLMAFNQGFAYDDVECISGSMVGNRMDEGSCSAKTTLSICYCVP